MSALATIQGYYRGIQFRDGPGDEAAGYAERVRSGALTLAQVRQTILDSPYTLDYVLPVIREYEAAFGRVPEFSAVAYWVTTIASGAFTINRLAQLFAASSEFATKFGAGADVDASFVNALYVKVLGRCPEEAGLAFWIGSGRERWEVLNFLAQSDEFTARAAPFVSAYLDASIAGSPRRAGSLFASSFVPVPGP
ncbi:DUF4214 domain-containing protein [Alsobacter sp. KACC 23698]|uniref:DUF4214 domain-containing protein n=1 Tax=Alsobacter sp. KACC 23698 TaxID=3149229 RepID=A0AAU7JJM7_9HYPH